MMFIALPSGAGPVFFPETSEGFGGGGGGSESHPTLLPVFLVSELNAVVY